MTIGSSGGQAVADEVRIIEQLAVVPSARRQGVGSALITAAEEIHRAEGAKLWVGAVDAHDAAALPFYEAEGFMLTGPNGKGIPDPRVEQMAQRAYAAAQAGMNRSAVAWFYKSLIP